MHPTREVCASLLALSGCAMKARPAGPKASAVAAPTPGPGCRVIRAEP